ncbi:hypothetical protein VE03_01459 [Pseudogymnoascus sp. 23342-1-I1]|nr:hypothetical protein VE03_01459 [Pseudogymnoascus sp. 23342-1-I1]
MDRGARPNITALDAAQRSHLERPFKCLECHHAFRRVEHLTRHARSHRTERFLECSFCRKGFYRLDALKRHEKVHSEPKRSALGKGARACLACAALRRRCSGETPCSTCERRSLLCEYPATSKGRQENLTSTPEEASNGSGAEHMGTSPHGSIMSWSNSSQSPAAAKGPDLGYRPAIGDQAGMSEHTFNPRSSTENGYNVHPAQNGYLFSGPISLALAQPHIAESQSPMNISYLISGNQIISGSNNPQLPSSPNFQNTAGSQSSNIQNDYHGPTQATEPWYQNGFSSINWLSDTWTPDFPMQDRDVGIESSNQRSSHILENSPGIGAPGCNDAALHMSSPQERSGPHRYPAPLGNQGIDRPQSTPSAGHFYIDGDGARLPRVRKAPYGTESFTPTPHHENAMHGDEFIFPEVDEPLENSTPNIKELPHTTYDDILQVFKRTSSIGSHYMESEDNDIFIVAMHEFTRRAIQTVTEADDYINPSGLVLIQAKLLNIIGISDFDSFCSSEWALSMAQTGSDLSNNFATASNDWETWHEEESRRRTGYCIWMLDCMSTFHFGTRSALTLEDARVPLPCQEVLWEAESALDWQQLYEASTPNPSLHAAIQLAYVEKHLQSSMGEFSRILCIHALFRRTHEVAAFFQQPLTLWSPKAERQSISIIERSMPVWLPDIPTYAKWRNSACDVLDILHWHANSVIGVASGMEHPTILHLHLARVVLLTPLSHIMRLARFRAGEAMPASDSELTRTQDYVRRWAQEDQHKSRLAMIHAGVLFWHVRRYSADAFYEPAGVFLATLAMWAYGTFATYTPTLKDGESPGDEDDVDALFPTLMRLDRPADDELVQLFVKRGGGMRAVVTGVGNLCSTRGPVRVLIEGRRLLMELKRWGDSRRAVRSLSALIEWCEQGEAI